MELGARRAPEPAGEPVPGTGLGVVRTRMSAGHNETYGICDSHRARGPEWPPLASGLKKPAGVRPDSAVIGALRVKVERRRAEGPSGKSVFRFARRSASTGATTLTLSGRRLDFHKPLPPPRPLLPAPRSRRRKGIASEHGSVRPSSARGPGAEPPAMRSAQRVRACSTHARMSAARRTPPVSGTVVTTSCLKRW